MSQDLENYDTSSICDSCQLLVSKPFKSEDFDETTEGDDTLVQVFQTSASDGLAFQMKSDPDEIEKEESEEFDEITEGGDTLVQVFQTSASDGLAFQVKSDNDEIEKVESEDFDEITEGGDTLVQAFQTSASDGLAFQMKSDPDEIAEVEEKKPFLFVDVYDIHREDNRTGSDFENIILKNEDINIKIEEG